VEFGFKTLKAIGVSIGSAVSKTVETVRAVASKTVETVKLAVANIKHTVARAVRPTRAAVVGASAIAALVFGASEAFAQAAGGGTIGAQLGTMAQEGSTAGGTIASMAMYVGALVIFIAGAWALWESRDPATREPGKFRQGLAALVLTGLMVSGGLWIGKASQTATGAAAVESSTAAAVGF
jgi:hypothetical protein